MTNITKCPECGSRVLVKDSKYGKFLGCEKWKPNKNGCNWTGKINSLKQQKTTNNTNSEQGVIQEKPQISTTWSDKVYRNAWSTEYHEIGSCPSFIQSFVSVSNAKIQKIISQSYFLFKSPNIKDRRKTEESDFISAILLKILQRGRVPSSTLELESKIIEKYNLDSVINKNKDPSDTTYKLHSQTSKSINNKSTIYSFTQRDELIIDEEFNHCREKRSLFDDASEIDFLKKWVPKNLGNQAQNWFIPQASLDRIIQSYEDDRSIKADRRVDFLFLHPNCKKTLAIEIDGQQHSSAQNIDQERDDSLAQCGIQVIRVATSELKNGSGPNLDIIKNYCKDIFDDNLTKEEKIISNIIHDSSFCSKVQFSIVKALKYGWLEDQKVWKIQIRGLDSIVVSAVIDIIKMLSSLNRIYKIALSPKSVIILCDKKEIYIDENFKVIKKFKSSTENESNLIIEVQKNKSSLHAITGEANPDSADIIIRSAFLPVPLELDNVISSGISRRHVGENILEQDLTLFLNHIFRKNKFREGQFISIANVIRQKDSVILLPTGAGKSLIYQLAGLLMPGVTIVIDPIIALIEDQVEGLSAYGVDRAAGISSSISKNQMDILLGEFKRAQYHFIFLSPERLQSPKFRKNLGQLTQSSIVNLVAIDEAHCVS